MEPTFLKILRHVDQTLTSVGSNLSRNISYRSLRGLLCIRVFEARFHTQFLTSNVDSRKNDTENQCCVTDREKLQTYRGLVTQLIRQPQGVLNGFKRICDRVKQENRLYQLS